MAFSRLFVVPAALAAALWIVLRIIEREIGLHVAPVLWLLLVLTPVIISGAVANWVCRRADTGNSARLGFSFGAAALALLFSVVAMAWLVPLGD